MLFYHEGNAICTLWCLIEGLEHSGSWINLQRLISGGGLENDRKCYGKGNGFLSHICIKVALPSPQNETTLNHTTHAISVLIL